MLRLAFWVVLMMFVWALFHDGIGVTTGGVERTYKIDMLFHKPVLGK